MPDSDCQAVGAKELCTLRTPGTVKRPSNLTLRLLLPRRGHPLHATFERKPPVMNAVDCMGAATRSGLDAGYA